MLAGVSIVCRLGKAVDSCAFEASAFSLVKESPDPVPLKMKLPNRTVLSAIVLKACMRRTQ